MKVYNITDVKAFLKRLDNCSDTVELSDESGKSYTVGAGHKAEDLAGKFGRKISKADLNFHNATDCIDIVRFLAGMSA